MKCKQCYNEIGEGTTLGLCDECLNTNPCKHDWEYYEDSSPTYKECLICKKRENNYEY
jgi:hypothetical protein